MLERVRFAPSPTGALHIGGLRTALFNYLYSKKNKGTFILRLEDTDQKRLVSGSEEYIEKSLKWAGITLDEGPSKGGPFGPYRQSERLRIYKEKVNLLLKSGKAYYAFDKTDTLSNLRLSYEQKGEVFKYDSSVRDNLDNSLNISQKEAEKRIKNEPYVIRIKVEKGKTKVKDLLRGEIIIDNSILDDKVLIKADGFPTYHLANVVDDYLMKITTVIRGEEWLPSLTLHKLIYNAFNWVAPKFVHLPLILKGNGKGKLSKRDAKIGGFPLFPINWKKEPGFKELGFTNSALINYLALLGWSKSSEKEIYTIDELVRDFKLSGLQKGGAKFDYEKAKWFNHQHLSLMNYDKFQSLYPDELSKLTLVYKNRTESIFDLVKGRFSLVNDFKNETDFFVDDPKEYDASIIKTLSEYNVIELITEIEKSINKNNLSNIKDELAAIAVRKKTPIKITMQILRVAIIGRLKGPDILLSLKILGKSVTLNRITSLKKFIKNNQ
ncbi:MAG: glutamate--tRNA ligase [Flavobacteriaceae bacterium]|nr:glutamate--tRNA ligase [Flavobacteriaceae bacterium]